MLNINLISQIISDKNNSVYKSEMINRPGQLIFGKITEVFPEGFAKIQIGDKSIIAKLETPVQNNQSYIFFIENTDEDMISLKVLTSSDKFDLITALNRLKSEWGISGNSNVDKILLSLIERGKPLQKEFVLNSHALFKNQNVTDVDIKSLITILDRKLPLTSTVFQSIKEVNSKSTMMSSLENIVRNIKNIDVPAAKNLVTIIQETVKPIIDNNEKLEYQDTKTRQGVQETPLKALENREVMKSIIRVVLDMPDSDIKSTMKFQILSKLINDIDLSQTEVSKSVSQTKLNTTEISIKNEIIKNLVTSNNNTNSLELGSFIDKINFQENIKSQNLNQYLNSLLKDIDPNVKEKITNNIILRVLDNINNLESTPIETQLKEALLSITKKMGYDHEFVLGNRNISDIDKATLKQALLDVLRDDNIPNANKAEIEILVNKITGTQLLSINKDSPIHTIITQIPFVFNESFKGDLKIQWQGKKNEEGKIDPSFCRILFYLDLSNIGSTILDVHVINKVVNLQVINENKFIEKIAIEEKGELYNQLQSISYSLGSLKFSDALNKKTNKNQTINQELVINSSSYQGVDIKI